MLNCIVEIMMGIRGSAICNKITLDNLYKLEERDIRVGDWDTAAICRRINVNGT